MLTKARFEEAKFRELGRSEPGLSRRQNLRVNAGVGRQFSSTNGGNATPNIRCFKCGSMGHIASKCPMKGRSSREDQRSNQQSNNSGNASNKTVNIIVAEGKEPQQDTIRQR